MLVLCPIVLTPASAAACCSSVITLQHSYCSGSNAEIDTLAPVLQNFSDPAVILPDLGMPSDHGNHYMTIGPDGMIYFNLGAPFNIGSPLPAVGTRDLTFGTIARMTPDGQNISTFATGPSAKYHCSSAFGAGPGYSLPDKQAPLGLCLWYKS